MCMVYHMARLRVKDAHQKDMCQDKMRLDCVLKCRHHSRLKNELNGGAPL